VGFFGWVFLGGSFIANPDARSHANERSAVCDACGKRFLQTCDLNKHKLSAHSGEKPFVCPACGRSFARRDYLRSHSKIHQLPSLKASDADDEFGLAAIRRLRTVKPLGRRSRHNLLATTETVVVDQDMEDTGGVVVYSPGNNDNNSSSGLILEDVVGRLDSIVEGGETLLVVTSSSADPLDKEGEGEDLVIEQFKDEESLMVDSSSAFL
jgi:hypothetical protein